MKDIDEQVADIIAEALHIARAEIKPTSRFVEDLKANSIDLVELVMSVEEELGVEIRDDKIDTLFTVGQLIAYIKTEQQHA